MYKREGSQTVHHLALCLGETVVRMGNLKVVQVLWRRVSVCDTLENPCKGRCQASNWLRKNRAQWGWCGLKKHIYSVEIKSQLYMAFP